MNFFLDNPPCKNCILIPICRHKPYHSMVGECAPVYKYLRLTEDEIVNNEMHDNQSERILNVEKLLTPTRWRLYGELIENTM